MGIALKPRVCPLAESHASSSSCPAGMPYSTTIGGLLSAIGISGLDRLLQKNVIATSGKAIEAAGDVDVLLMDKTGTITLGNRMATEFIPANKVSNEELADAAQLSSLADETPEGRSIVILAKELYNIRGRNMESQNTTFIPFTAQSRMSGWILGYLMVRFVHS